jgi:hypothetical protein
VIIRLVQGCDAKGNVPWSGANSEIIDTLVCDGKTLRSSIDQTASDAARFIAQVSFYSNTFGVAIAQNTCATDAAQSNR